MATKYHVKWYQDNREKHINYCKEKIKCDLCDCKFNRSNLTNHKRSKKHINNMKIKKLEKKINNLKDKNKI